jgi:CheY-like chemotaxis protein
MPDGGELVIRAGNTVLNQEDARSIPEISPGNYVMLSVADSGGGMTDDVLRKAVQPFFTTKAPGSGSGLGLSVVYGFIKQSKGHMELASDVGRGTTVTLYFPASTSVGKRQVTGEDVDLACPGKGERVLLVEDQPNVRRSTRRLLTRLGYNVLEAADGRSALRMLERNRAIDILFTDIILPGQINGVMLGRAALAVKPDLGVLYTTGYAINSPSVGHHLRDASTILLRKPIRIEELSRALRLALDQRPSA